MYLGLLCGGLYSCNDDPTPLPTSKNFITKYQNPVSICAIVSGSLETSVPTETYNVVSLQIRPYENTEDCYEEVTNCVHEHDEDCYPEESVSGNEATPSGAQNGSRRTAHTSATRKAGVSPRN